MIAMSDIFINKTGLQRFFNNIKGLFVKKSGDTMTGDLTIAQKDLSRLILKTTNGGSVSTLAVHPDPDESAYGNILVIQAGGAFVAGGGESPNACYNSNVDGCATGAESAHISADSAVYLYSNCNTIANRKTWTFDADGNFITPSTGKIIATNGLDIRGGAGAQTSPPYFLCLSNSFASDGNVGYVNKANMLSAIGAAPVPTISYKNFSALSIANGTDTTLGNTGSLAVGTYLLVATGSFAKNTSGRRCMFLTTTTSGAAPNRYAESVVAPANGDATKIQLTYPVEITSATTFYLRAYQNSGGKLSVTGGIAVIKIA